MKNEDSDKNVRASVYLPEKMKNELMQLHPLGNFSKVVRYVLDEYLASQTQGLSDHDAEWLLRAEAKIKNVAGGWIWIQGEKESPVFKTEQDCLTALRVEVG